MSKLRALALLIALAGCHRGNVADVTLDADRASENATAAKTRADLAEADKAAGAPLPERAARPAAVAKPAEPAPDADEAPSEANAGDTAHP